MAQFLIGHLFFWNWAAWAAGTEEVGRAQGTLEVGRALGTWEVGRAQGTWEGTLLEVAGRAACTAAAAETFFWSLRIWKKLHDSVHKKEFLKKDMAKIMQYHQLGASLQECALISLIPFNEFLATPSLENCFISPEKVFTLSYNVLKNIFV